MAARAPSELECFVLGLVWQLGPCSAYALRRHMQGSPSTQWSASGGSIYPLMARLERRGLLESRAMAGNGRGRREYRISGRGLAALREWVGPPLRPEAVTTAYDPLRSRARFLGALPAGQRGAWIGAAREALHEVERRVRAWHDANASALGDAAETMTASGELDVRSRLEWLARLESARRHEG